MQRMRKATSGRRYHGIRYEPSDLKVEKQGLKDFDNDIVPGSIATHTIMGTQLKTATKFSDVSQTPDFEPCPSISIGGRTRHGYFVLFVTLFTPFRTAMTIEVPSSLRRFNFQLLGPVL